MEEFDFDIGAATPEGYDEVNREALHILNVNFIGEENRSRVLKFVIARILRFQRHLPEGSSQRIRFDLRGQVVGNKYLENTRQAIFDEAARCRINVSVEFLTNC